MVQIAHLPQCFRCRRYPIRALQPAILHVALLEIARDQPSQAEKISRDRAAELAQQEKEHPGSVDKDDEALTRGVLALSLLAGGGRSRLNEASSIMSKVDGTRNCPLWATLEITKARVQSNIDQKVARLALSDVADRTQRLGLVGHRFETELAMIEVDLLSGQSVSAGKHAADLQGRAQSAGFLLIARLAKSIEAKAKPSTRKDG